MVGKKGKGRKETTKAKEDERPQGRRTAPAGTSKDSREMGTQGKINVGSKAAKGKEEARSQTVKIRTHKRAAILLSMKPEGEEAMDTTDSTGQDNRRKMGEVLATIKGEIKLADFGIEALKPKRTIARDILYEVPGKDNKEKAEKLADKFKELLEPKGVKVVVPTKRAEVRILGLDDMTTTEDIIEAIVREGECLKEEVKVGKINRSFRDRLRSCWVQCPAKAASRIAEAGTLSIGWVKARVEALKARPLQCYRCMGAGHTRSMCTEETDRSDLCYRCGKPGHKVSECQGVASCPFCKDHGMRSDHRYGGKACGYAKVKARPIKESPEKNKEAVKEKEEQRMEITSKGREEASTSNGDDK